jgi:hypothetical protein
VTLLVDCEPSKGVIHGATLRDALSSVMRFEFDTQTRQWESKVEPLNVIEVKYTVERHLK